MYKSLKISGYRGFDSFELKNLGRVNLLVGTNNSGKTSILESIELLKSTSNLKIFSSILRRRGEWNASSDDGGYKFGYLLYGRNPEGKIVVEASHENSLRSLNWNRKVEISIADISNGLFPIEDIEIIGDRGGYLVNVQWSNASQPRKFGVTYEGDIRDPRIHFRPRPDIQESVQFVHTNGMTAREIKLLYDEVVLTENEKHVIGALNIIEPTIERIASVGEARIPPASSGSAGIFLKLSDFDQRIPIGSMGDGMWRLLGLALVLAAASDGVVLIDEIDTGMHYSVMQKMWEMVSERSAALNVQVFATTHSRDCYESLAGIAEPNSSQTGVAIHRIDPNRNCAVSFSDKEIVAAAKRGLEVR